MLISKIKKLLFSKKDAKQKSRNILIIDDGSKNREFLYETLRKKGYNVITEQNEKNGYAVAKEKKPDLIIVGAVIAGNKSVRLCAKLKNGSKTKSIPILVIAGPGKNIKSIEYYDKGVDYFITTSIPQNDLLKQIGILIEK